jgi:hypothetical protein
MWAQFMNVPRLNGVGGGVPEPERGDHEARQQERERVRADAVDGDPFALRDAGVVDQEADQKSNEEDSLREGQEMSKLDADRLFCY